MQALHLVLGAEGIGLNDANVQNAGEVLIPLYRKY